MDIFICYSSQNRQLVESLARDLHDLGHIPWYDQNLSGGQKWWDEITQKILGCDLFVFALTPQSLASYPCELERNYAFELNKRILPVCLEEVDTTLLTDNLKVIHFVDYREQDSKRSALELSKALSSLPRSSELPSPVPKPPDVPLPALGGIKQRIDAPRLTYQQQITLVFELKQFLLQREAIDNARNLLLRMRNRADVLLASVAREIDSLLVAPPFRDDLIRVLESMGVVDATPELYPPLECMKRVEQNLAFIGILASKWVTQSHVRRNFENFLQKIQNRNGSVRFLLVDPFSNAFELLKRQRGGISTECLRYHRELCKHYPSYRIRFYDQLPSFRLVFMDKATLALASYRLDEEGFIKSEYGYKSPHLILNAYAEWSLYNVFSRYFEELWNASKQLEDLPVTDDENRQ